MTMTKVKASMKQRYFPILKWGLAEQSALQALLPAQRVDMLPIAEIESRPYSSDSLEYIGTWEDHFSIVAASTAKRWGTYAEIGIDQGIMDIDCPESIDLWTLLFAALRREEVRFVPVLCSSASVRERQALRAANKAARSLRWIFRIRVRELDRSDGALATRIESLRDVVEGRPESIDVVLDYCRVDQSSVSHSITAIGRDVAEVQALAKWRSVVVASGGFPASVTDLSPGFHRIPRSDWQLFEHLRDSGLLIEYADYGSAHHAAFDIDPRGSREAVRLVYTEKKDWLVGVGYTPKARGHEQFRELCIQLAGKVSGDAVVRSFGDQQIRQRATDKPMRVGVGGPTQWRRDAMNHHVEVVLSQLRTFAAPAKLHGKRRGKRTASGVFEIV